MKALSLKESGEPRLWFGEAYLNEPDNELSRAGSWAYTGDENAVLNQGYCPVPRLNGARGANEMRRKP